jgi:hypothetical protein
MHRYLLLLFVLFSLPSLAQIKGRVTDAQTGQPLAFVHVAVKDTRHGTMTDIDGFFTLYTPVVNNMLQFSYVGYFSTIQQADHSEMMQVQMHPRPYQLQEVVVYPGDNPAHRIIMHVIQNKQANDPEGISSFTYTSYNKFVATLDRDFYLQRWEATGNPLNKRMVNVLDKRHVFLMESVTERSFLAPNHSNEVIIANRVSGFENPMFSMLATELQPFSFYGSSITLLGINYVSPLTRSAFSRYSYHLRDTLYQGKDSVFIISYEPVKNSNFEGLKGLLYINSNQWAIQNVIAEPAIKKVGGLHFKIQQKYEFINQRYWFPVQLNTDIDFFSSRASDPSARVPIRMLGRSYIKDITIDPPLRSRDFSNYTVDFNHQANRVQESFWNQYRPDTLSPREANTYVFMDSLGAANNFDMLLNTFEPLAYGSLPLGSLSIPISSIYRYNEVEKHRLGIGLRTNHRFSRRFYLGGHYAWGSGDRMEKYGYFGELVLHKHNDIRLGGTFSFDTSERGGNNFMQQNFFLSTLLIRNLYMNKMDYTRESSAYLTFQMFRGFLQGELKAGMGTTSWTDAYTYLPTAESAGLQAFDFTETSLRLRYSYGESLINTPTKTIRMPSSYPVLYLNIRKGFDNVYNGKVDYLKLEARADINYNIPLWGRQSWVLEGGWSDHQNLPWALLFTAKAANRSNFLAAPFSFGTMYMNEFVADQYAAVFFQHNFQSLLFRRPRYTPELVLITNAGFGMLSFPHRHQFMEAGSWEKGYFESGFAINKILPRHWIRRVVFGISPGIEVLYRYGPYAMPRVKDNITVKVNVVTAF